MCSLLYTFISFERKKTARAEARSAARAEAFQPGHLTWRALASRRHCLNRRTVSRPNYNVPPAGPLIYYVLPRKFTTNTV